MFMVYWTVVENDVKIPYSQEFESDQMVAAMNLTEQLRTRQRAGERICFITMCSENPDSVGNPGVADVGPDYSWKKRRR